MKKQIVVLKKYLFKIKSMIGLFTKNNHLNNFCILLTASIEPNGCTFLKRNDPKIREQDYIDSLTLWLSKTNLPIVFCENSGYDLKNIKEVCDKYPNRVEIIQFNGNNYPRHFGKGYGELKIIEKALNESKFIKNTENIIKCTGRVFVDNINKIIDSCDDDFMVSHTPKKNIIHTVIFIFKKDFFKYFNNYSEQMDDSRGMIFEYFFEKALDDVKKQGYKISTIQNPYYVGISGGENIDYNKII